MSNYGRYTPQPDVPTYTANQIYEGRSPSPDILSKTQARQPRYANASTYNHITYNPETQAALDGFEKTKRREKQYQYKDQLDQMMSRNDLHSRHGDDIGRKSPISGVQASPTKLPYPEPVSSFQQQDQMREKLLTKIRHGYTKYNGGVHGLYQQAYQEKEKEREEFEKNVVDRAYQAKLEREDKESRIQWQKKKTMEQDAYTSNIRTLETNEAMKKRQKAVEEAAEAKALQDSIKMMEINEFKKKEAERRRADENNRVLLQQMKDLTVRKKTNDVAWEPQRKKDIYDAYQTTFINAVNKSIDTRLKNSTELQNKEHDLHSYTKGSNLLPNFDQPIPSIDNRFSSKNTENPITALNSLKKIDNTHASPNAKQHQSYANLPDHYKYKPEPGNYYQPEPRNNYRESPSLGLMSNTSNQALTSKSFNNLAAHIPPTQSYNNLAFQEPNSGASYDRTNTLADKEQAMFTYGYKFDQNQKMRISDKIRQGAGFNIISNDVR